MVGYFSRAEQSKKSALGGEEMEKLVPVKSKGWEKGKGKKKYLGRNQPLHSVLLRGGAGADPKIFFCVNLLARRETDNEKGKL